MVIYILGTANETDVQIFKIMSSSLKKILDSRDSTYVIHFALFNFFFFWKIIYNFEDI